MSILILLAIVLLVLSGFFNLITWSFNIPAIIVLLVIGVVAIFNSLVRARNRVKEAWSDIDVQLKRRYDLIPNLIETVKGYASHESGVFEKVTAARTAAMGAQGPTQKAEAENVLSGALKSLFAVSEAYPTLRASENFAKLQDELSDTENKIQAARRFYNTNVLELNNKIETFPTNIFAGILHFSKENFFEVSAEAERTPVAVKF
ncbi:MAG: LemA family protein [Parcubacteria group bacterium GW2011_GWA1_44_13]|nr:MAG: LemA family protein [Parcubacteria group bacterium GW2011_GWA1_44_13]